MIFFSEKVPNLSRRFPQLPLAWRWARNRSLPARMKKVLVFPSRGKEEDSGMKIRYLFVDRFGQLVKIRRSLVEDLWQGELGALEIGSGDGNELRLVSVLCDQRLLPKKIFLLRLPLSRG